MYTIPILIFLVGLVLGSFLNVIIYRINDLRSVITGRSYCPACKTQLKWYDLIPVISFMLLKTRCRYCGTKISWQYPIVEVVTAAAMFLLYLMFGLSSSFVFYAVVFLILGVVFVHDLKTKLVPEEFVWVALVLTLLGGWYFGGFSFWNSILGGMIAGGFPALLVLVSREQWMGAGDIKLAVILGLLLGYPLAIAGLFIAFVLGSIVGLVLIGLKQKKMQDQLPFAPFLITATFISLICGNYILNWYFSTVAFGG